MKALIVMHFLRLSSFFRCLTGQNYHITVKHIATEVARKLINCNISNLFFGQNVACIIFELFFTGKNVKKICFGAIAHVFNRHVLGVKP